MQWQRFGVWREKVMPAHAKRFVKSLTQMCAETLSTSHRNTQTGRETQTHKHTNAQTHNHTNTQTDVQLKKPTVVGHMWITDDTLNLATPRQIFTLILGPICPPAGILGA